MTDHPFLDRIVGEALAARRQTPVAPAEPPRLWPSPRAAAEPAFESGATEAPVPRPTPPDYEPPPAANPDPWTPTTDAGPDPLAPRPPEAAPRPFIAPPFAAAPFAPPPFAAAPFAPPPFIPANVASGILASSGYPVGGSPGDSWPSADPGAPGRPQAACWNAPPAAAAAGADSWAGPFAAAPEPPPRGPNASARTDSERSSALLSALIDDLERLRAAARRTADELDRVKGPVQPALPALPANHGAFRI